jgi:hypothetical protein
MNRHAVILAADSATTVSQWTGSKREVRYFKGANKIHPLSDHRPVGLMLFAGADILNVPWEVAIKEFRKSLGDKSFNNVSGYAEEFFSFLESENRFFPLEVQKDNILQLAKRYAWRVSIDVATSAGDEIRDQWTTLLDAEVQRRRIEIDKAALNHRLDDAWVANNVMVWVPELVTLVDGYLNVPDKEPRPSNFIALAELALWTVLKEPEDHLGSTGLVVAGYGDHDIFPSYVQYVSAGLVAGKHIVREASREKIDHEQQADLSAFAQKGMIETFELGLDMAIYIDAILCLDDALNGFAEMVVKQSGGNSSKIGSLALLKEAARDKFSKQWLQNARNNHAYPLKRVLGSLPIKEMAELAETLVNLQSLKEKVTKPSEEVGGPVDVAVITKAEGLVWIRRKHYFDPTLNARYMARLGGLYR